MSNYVSYDRLVESNKSFVNQLSSVFIPNNVQEALGDSAWKASMDEEMKSLRKNGIWDIVELPAVKYKVDGTIERYKARLVAKGYTQTHGINYL